MPTIAIDPNGDLTLLLTKGTQATPEPSTLALLVSTKPLTLASPVFAAMLSPRFLEGQRSADGSLAPIPLPDDDMDAMAVLCRILHFQNAALPAKPSLQLFRDLALLADKYDCVVALQFVSEQWLLMWEMTADVADLEVLLFVSFVFGRAERFASLSTRMVQFLPGKLKELGVLRSLDAVPDELLRALHQQRKGALKEFEMAIAHYLELMDQALSSFPITAAARSCPKCFRAVMSDYCNHCHVSTCSKICSQESRRGKYVGILKDAGLNPVALWSEMSKKSIFEIGGSDCSVMCNAEKAAESHSCAGMAECPLKAAFIGLQKKSRQLAACTRGLCLDCLNAECETIGLNMLSSNKSDCRVDHTLGYAKAVYHWAMISKG